MTTNIRFESGRFFATNTDPWDNYKSIEFDMKDLTPNAKKGFIQAAESISGD